MKHISLFALLAAIGCFALPAQQQEGFRSLKVDAGKITGEIHSFQGLNGPPSPVMAGLPELVDQYRDLRVDQVRTTQELMRPIERFIQQHPDQWHVPHRIWSGSP